MNDIYCLKIEVNLPSQFKLVDMILGVEHDVEESHTWVLTMDYDRSFGDLPIFYITNFINLLKDKFADLERIGIRRDMISIWRCINQPGEVYMEYWPEELRLLAAEGIKFRMLCRADPEPEPEEGPGMDAVIFPDGGFRC